MADVIWHKRPNVDELNSSMKQTMIGHLGILVTEVGDNYIKGTMPVSERTVQPLGAIHGGANVALAESLGSVAANFVVDDQYYYCVGQEVNANHVRSVNKGIVTAVSRPVYIGRSSHVWETLIYDEREKLTCISRLTVSVLKHNMSAGRQELV